MRAHDRTFSSKQPKQSYTQDTKPRVRTFSLPSFEPAPASPLPQRPRPRHAPALSAAASTTTPASASAAKIAPPAGMQAVRPPPRLSGPAPSPPTGGGTALGRHLREERLAALGYLVLHLHLTRRDWEKDARAA